MMIHLTTIRTWPPLMHFITRSISTGIRASILSTINAVIAVTVLSRWFHEQNSGYYMRKSSGVGTESVDYVKCVASMVFQIFNLIHELRGNDQIPFPEPLIEVTSPSKQLEIIQKVID